MLIYRLIVSTSPIIFDFMNNLFHFLSLPVTLHLLAISLRLPLSHTFLSSPPFQQHLHYHHLPPYLLIILQVQVLQRQPYIRLFPLLLLSLHHRHEVLPLHLDRLPRLYQAWIFMLISPAILFHGRGPLLP